MPRRLLTVLTIVCVTALSASAVAFAHSGHHNPGARTHHHGKIHHRGAVGGMWGASLTSVAQRLGVTPDALRDAVKAVAADQRAARQQGAPRPDLATLKTTWINGLADKLGKTPDEVSAAIRAELDARLTQAVDQGWLTAKGKDIALACFDTPDSCDFQALRREVRFGHHHRGGDGQRHHEGDGTMRPGGRQTSAPLT